MAWYDPFAEWAWHEWPVLRYAWRSVSVIALVALGIGVGIGVYGAFRVTEYVTHERIETLQLLYNSEKKKTELAETAKIEADAVVAELQKKLNDMARGLDAPPLVQAWGTDPPFCFELLDPTRLLAVRETYDLAVVCGINDPTVDKFEDQRITVSSPFTIRPGTPISILVRYSDAMEKALEKVRAELRKSVPPGTQVGFKFSTWYEPILVPKGINVASIRRLSDVPRYGGKILSQGMPDADVTSAK